MSLTRFFIVNYDLHGTIIFMKSFRKVLFSLFLMLFSLYAEESIDNWRIWISNDGKELEALYYGSKEDKVHLCLKESFKEVIVPLQRLSEVDQLIVKEKGWEAHSGKWLGWRKDIALGKLQVAYDEIQHERHYESKHFSVKSVGDLPLTTWQNIFRQLEAFYLFMDSSPWGITATPDKNKYDVIIARDEHDYHVQGGLHGSAGVFIKDRQLVMTFPSALGPKGDQLDVISHELTHLLMDDLIGVCPAWFIEGIAEYVTCFPILAGKISTNGHYKKAKEYAENTYRRDNIRIDEVYNLSLKDWQKSGVSPERVKAYYYNSFLIAYYLIEANRRESIPRLKRYITARKYRSLELEEKLSNMETELDKYNKQFELYNKVESFAEEKKLLH